MSSLWENSRIRDNNFLVFLKRLVIFMLLDSDGVSRPSWGAENNIQWKILLEIIFQLTILKK